MKRSCQQNATEPKMYPLRDVVGFLTLERKMETFWENKFHPLEAVSVRSLAQSDQWRGTAPANCSLLGKVHVLLPVFSAEALLIQIFMD